MSLSRKGLVLIGILLTIQLALSVALLGLHQRSAQHIQNIQRSVTESTSLSTLLLLLMKFNDRYLSTKVTAVDLSHSKVATQVREQMEECKKIFQEQPRVFARLEQAQRDLKRIDLIMMKEHEMIKSGRETEEQMRRSHLELRGKLWQIFEADRKALYSDIEVEQDRVQALLEKSRAESRLNMFGLIGGVAAEILLILCAIAFFHRDISRRMRVILANAELLPQQKTLLARVEGADELAKLDTELHNVANMFKNAMKHEKAMLEEQRDVICRIDEAFKIVQVNQSSHAAFGLAPEELCGKSVGTVFHPDDWPQVLAQFQSSKNVRQGEFEARTTNTGGEVRHMVWTVRWSATEGTFFCVVHDITAQKQAEQLRQEVAQMVSHDLRTPLTTVNTFFQMVETSMFGQLSGEAEKSVKRGLDATNKLQVVIKRFLETEKKRAGV